MEAEAQPSAQALALVAAEEAQPSAPASAQVAEAQPSAQALAQVAAEAQPSAQALEQVEAEEVQPSAPALAQVLAQVVAALPLSPQVQAQMSRPYRPPMDRGRSPNALAQRPRAAFHDRAPMPERRVHDQRQRWRHPADQCPMQIA